MAQLSSRGLQSLKHPIGMSIIRLCCTPKITYDCVRLRLSKDGLSEKRCEFIRQVEAVTKDQQSSRCVHCWQLPLAVEAVALGKDQALGWMLWRVDRKTAKFSAQYSC